MNATLPPDPTPRAPKRPLPPGTVDCHAHILLFAANAAQLYRLDV